MPFLNCAAVGFHMQRVVLHTALEFPEAGLEFASLFLKLNLLGGELFKPCRVASFLQLKRVELITGAGQALRELGGFIVGVVEFGLALVDLGFGSFNDAAFFSDVLACAIECVAGIGQLLVDALQLGVHLFAAFLGSGNIGFRVSMLGVEFLHALLIVLNAVFVALHF